MKKQISLGAAVLFTVGMLFMTGCKKDDTSLPTISLIGNSSMTISLQGTFTDPGVTANDDEDGDISASVTSDMSSTNPNKNLKGTYTITYSVSDAAGNTGTATRTVIVKNDVDAMTGNYQCTIAPSYVYPQIITASTTTNNRINFSKFANYLNNTNIFANIIGATVDLPSQEALNVGTPPNNTNRTFVGTGSTNATGFVLNYTDSTSAGTAPFSETFVKQ